MKKATTVITINIEDGVYTASMKDSDAYSASTGSGAVGDLVCCELGHIYEQFFSEAYDSENQDDIEAIGELVCEAPEDYGIQINCEYLEESDE